jgi:hypothetical protein
MFEFAKKRRNAAKRKEIEDAFDRGTLNFISWWTKFWFELIGWLIVIGALQFLKEQTMNPLIDAAYWISIGTLMLFIMLPIDIQLTKLAKGTPGKIGMIVLSAFISSIIILFLKLMMDDLQLLNSVSLQILQESQ